MQYGTDQKEVRQQQEITQASDEDCVLLGPQDKYTGSTSWADSEQETASRAASQMSRFLS
jgi:hypothetical protein